MGISSQTNSPLEFWLLWPILLHSAYGLGSVLHMRGNKPQAREHRDGSQKLHISLPQRHPKEFLHEYPHLNGFLSPASLILSWVFIYVRRVTIFFKKRVNQLRHNWMLQEQGHSPQLDTSKCFCFLFAYCIKHAQKWSEKHELTNNSRSCHSHKD